MSPTGEFGFSRPFTPSRSGATRRTKRRGPDAVMAGTSPATTAVSIFGHQHQNSRQPDSAPIRPGNAARSARSSETKRQRSGVGDFANRHDNSRRPMASAHRNSRPYGRAIFLRSRRRRKTLLLFMLRHSHVFESLSRAEESMFASEASNPRSRHDIDAEHGSGTTSPADFELGCVNPIARSRERGRGEGACSSISRRPHYSGRAIAWWCASTPIRPRSRPWVSPSL